MIDKKELIEKISFENFYSGYFPSHKKLSNGEWVVLCPFHDDHKPSMSVNIKSGMFCCHSCGAQGDFIQFYQKKTGLSYSGSINAIGKQIGLQDMKPRILKTYDYVDEKGVFVSQTVRFEPKKFSQRTKKGGDWVWSLKGVETVLYNLPEVIKAKRVLVVEGEKDCDNAKALGYTATTCPMGAGAWKEQYDKFLYGKEIILIPDNDQVGIRHMIRVGNRLKDKADVKWFDFPETRAKGYDFSDLIASYQNEFEAMEGIDGLLRAARRFDPAGIIIPEPDTEESERIKAWIAASPGEFSTRDLDYDLSIKGVQQKQMRTKILEKFVAEKILSRAGKRRGVYRPYKKDLETINFKTAETVSLPIILPLGIHKMVKIMPGNIIILAGESNAGKTALALNIIKDNMALFDVHYFNSEMGDGELKNRLKMFDDIFLDQWRFNAYRRSDNFADVVFTGKKSLNIIDFLEVHEDFYAVGEKIKQIHSSLNQAIAIIAIQKNKGAEFGLGGGRTMEKARLVLNVEPGRFKIVKAKNFVDPNLNPNGLVCRWKLINGCWFKMQGSGWYKQGQEVL
jgi:hypothetical protein